MYIGYIFTSSIFVTIFYLLNNNQDFNHNKLIFLLLFVQAYNHLVNIYLVIPILFVMMIVSYKKKFFTEAIVYFGLPLCFFYSYSIILTGLSALKISDVSFWSVINYTIKNFEIIIVNGLDVIFFNSYISDVNKFNLIN